MNQKFFLRLLAMLLAMTALFLCACGKEAVAAAPVPTVEVTPEPVVTPEPTPEPIVGEVLTDDDGDGIINYKFHYKGATVYAMIVLDPSRVFVGTAVPEPTGWGGYGLTLDDMAAQYDAVAGINAGGFIDAGGTGGGWPPDGITYSRGVNFSVENSGPVAGLTNENKMVVGYYDFGGCEALGIRDAVCFGPFLVQNGKKAKASKLEAGIGARTMIGQREDGAIVMVAIDGRQGYSTGVTFKDCIAIMAKKFECVNASNMDGGNSTCMYYNGNAVNRSANQAGGTRNLPDAWLVHALPDSYVRPEGVAEQIVLPENPLGEVKEYESACDQETCDRMYEFVCAFAEAYYTFFGTKYSDYSYPNLMQYVAPDCELRDRATLALMDRMWVNTWGTDVTNIVMNGAYSNGDGSYDILITADIYEHADYWNYDATGTPLRITVVEAPDAAYGYLATMTY